MPVPASAYSTVTCRPLAALRDTRKLKSVEPLSPSSRAEAEIIISGASSSSVIVPVPVAVEISAFAAPLRVTATVSFGSSRVSPVTDTVIVFRVSPAAKVRVPAVSAA